MNWTFHRGYAAFVLGLGAISLALGACSIADSTGAETCSSGGDNGTAGCPRAATGGGGSGGSFNTGPAGNGGVGGSTEEAGMGGSGNFGGGGDGGTGQIGPTADGGTDPDAATGPPAACAGMDMAPKVLYVSADDSNSMGSPAYAREIINLGFEPSTSRIRTYEFLNYYRIAYPAPEFKKLALFPEMAKTSDSTIADFQFALRSYDAPPLRRPMNFTFLIDTSGSMKGPGIARAKDAVHAIASQFVDGDVVSIVTSDAATKLEGFTVSGSNDPKITEILDGLTTGGTTDLFTSLTKTYAVAKNFEDSQRMNRVVFISDGGVNVGVTDIDLIKEKSADAQADGIHLVGIGTGPVLTYNDRLMDDVTDAGRGAYVYINSAAEATRMLADRFDETMDVAARAVQVKVTLPWYFRVQPVSTEAADDTVKVEPQYLAPSDAMVFLLQTTVCDASLYDSEDPVNIRVSWRTRDTNSLEVTESTVKLKDLFIDKSPTMAKGRAIVAYAEALKGCGVDTNGFSLCKDEAERRKVVREKLVLAQTLATEAKNGMPDAELDEILGIIANHVIIKP